MADGRIGPAASGGGPFDGIGPWIEGMVGGGSAAEVLGLDGVEVGSEEQLWPIEREAVVRAVASRRREFTVGRLLARRSLARLGTGPTAIPVGPDRAPEWPRGFVGSITHTSTVAAAVVARTVDVRSVGVDLELTGSVGRREWPTILTPGERSRYADGGEFVGWLDWATTIFSAKEAIYKATYPITGCWLGFNDVEIELDSFRGRFEARVAESADHPLASSILTGRFTTIAGHVLTATSIPSDGGEVPGDSLDAE